MSIITTCAVCHNVLKGGNLTCPRCGTVNTIDGNFQWRKPADPRRSDGSTANYYQLPPGAAELQDLISYRNMNAQLGEIFRAAYRYGQASHSDQLRDAKKIKFYAEAEIARLEKYGRQDDTGSNS